MVVGADPVGVVFGVDPASELVEQLRQALDEQDEFADEPVKLGRPGEGVGPAGAVVQLADVLGGGLGEVYEAGRDVGIVHARPPVTGAGPPAGVWRCR